MKTTVLAAVVTAVSTAAAAAPIQWTAGNGHWYDVVNDPLTWTAARAVADANGGYLATFTSADEQHFVLANALLDSDRSYWLGGSDAAAEGTWQWAVGPESGSVFFGPGASPGAYFDWGASEPNNTNGLEHFLALVTLGDGYWNDLPDATPSYLAGYIIEYDSLSPVPVPAALPLLLAGLGALLGLRWRHASA